MSGTAEQNATQVATTIEAASSAATSMLQLQAKAYSQTSTGSANSAALNDWTVFTGIIVPRISGMYVFTVRNSSGTTSYSYWFNLQVMNNSLFIHLFWATARGSIGSVYYIPRTNATTSGAGYQYVDGNNNLYLAIGTDFNMFVNLTTNPTSFTATLSRIG